MLTRSDEVIEILVSACFLERENTLHDDKKHHSEWEQVHLLPTVRSAFFDLRSHVGECSSKALEVVDVLIAGKTEVSDFKIEVVVYQDVLKF